MITKYVDVIYENLVIDTINEDDIFSYIDTFRDGKVPETLDENLLSFRSTLDKHEVFNEAFLVEAKDNRDGLKNAALMKTKYRSAEQAGAVFYDEQGQIVDTVNLSTSNLSGTAQAVTVDEMKYRLKRNNGANSFRLYSRGKVIYDSLTDMGNADQDGNEDWGKITISYAPTSKEDDITAKSPDDKGIITVPSSNDTLQFNVAKTDLTEIAKQLMNLNDDKYIYWIENGDKELFNTKTPAKTLIGKSLKLGDSRTIADKVADSKLGKFLGLDHAITGSKLSSIVVGMAPLYKSDYYFSYLDAGGKEHYRNYERKEALAKLSAEELSKRLDGKLEQEKKTRPSQVNRSIDIVKVVLHDSAGNVIASRSVNGEKVDKDVNTESKFRFVIILKNDNNYTIKSQVDFVLPTYSVLNKVTLSIDERIEKYIKENDILSKYINVKNACVLIFGPDGSQVYLSDKFRTMFDTQGKLLPGAPTYSYAEKKLIGTTGTSSTINTTSTEDSGEGSTVSGTENVGSGTNSNVGNDGNTSNATKRSGAAGLSTTQLKTDISKLSTSHRRKLLKDLQDLYNADGSKK